MKSLKTITLLIASAFLITVNPMQAATLNLDVAFTGETSHIYDTNMGGYSGMFTRLTMTSSQTINVELTDYDQITVRATLPAGQVFCVDPHDAFSPTSMCFDSQWMRDSNTLPGGGPGYTTVVTFLDAAGVVPTKTQDNTYIRNEGSQISFVNIFDMDNDPFYFSGFELTITGPFPSNSGTPLLSGNASAYVQSSSISNPSGD
ncbi:MAG: hypothetical protein GY794_22300, partial [bacterium]|nr:hypothetical protein [bacterium]